MVPWAGAQRCCTGVISGLSFVTRGCNSGFLPLFPLPGPSPSESQQTKAIFSLSEEDASGWSAAQEPSEPGCMTFTIASPANAVVGRYKLKLQMVSGNKVSSVPLGHFVLLFNPWCPSMFWCPSYNIVSARKSVTAKHIPDGLSWERLLLSVRLRSLPLHQCCYAAQTKAPARRVRSQRQAM